MRWETRRIFCMVKMIGKSFAKNHIYMEPTSLGDGGKKVNAVAVPIYAKYVDFRGKMRYNKYNSVYYI